MRQFILAANADYPTSVDAMTGGQVGIVYLKAGEETLITSTDAATEVPNVKRANIIWKNPNTKLGNILYPIYKNHFSYVKSEYVAATEFKTKVTISAPAAKTDYTIIVAKKGVKFNERNKWTATVHTGAVPGTAQSLATALAKHINGNSLNSGVKATSDATSVTITATTKGVDYEIIVADGLYGAALSSQTAGIPATNDAAMIKDLMNKAAADAGFEYTYNDFEGIYPAYDANPLASPDAVDAGFTVFTLRFAEPRDMKTRDEVVHQIVQIAYPTGSEAITKMEAILKAIAG